ncbi:MAG: hypothetical protein V3V00_15235 [Saprospiraceae bacterium]
MKTRFTLLNIVIFFFLFCSVHGQKKNLYSVIFEAEGTCNIKIETDLKHLMRKSSKEQYQEANITIIDNAFQELVVLPTKIRARGNMRKKQCKFPPIKIDFKKRDLDSLGFEKEIDKLKMVFPCRGGKDNQEKLYKEYLLYDIYKIIDPRGMNAKLANITFIEENGKEIQFVGMFVEEEKAYSKRTNAIIVEFGKLRVASLDRDLFLKMSFFQYMIANTDYSISNYHNLEMVKYPDNPRVVALPYDFDYSGFVGHHYAVPHESLPIKEVHERYFFRHSVKEEEFDEMVGFYLSIENEVNTLIDSATYLSEKSRIRSKAYLESFFNIMRMPKFFKRSTVR